MNNTFSLIIATYGRRKELEILLESIAKQNYDLNLIEVFIIDQNTEISLQNIIEKYAKVLNIKYIKSERKGTSFNRNIGIQYATGDILAFPDDDCSYYPDTLKNVNIEVNKDNTVSCFLGRIFDYSTGKNIVRNWKKYSFRVNWWNFYQNYSEIVTFVKRKDSYGFYFCEQLGPGTDFGSCEGVDYLSNFLKNNLKIKYSPSIAVWHPQEKIEEFSQDKNYQYGKGFGAFCKKNLNPAVLLLFVEVLIYHVLWIICAIFTGNDRRLKIRKQCVQSRIEGWQDWK